MSFLGIDIGTTGAKAVVFNECGNVRAEAAETYDVVSPQNGWFELDPDVVIAACHRIIAKAASCVKHDDPVRSIGIASQGEAFTLLDADDRYLVNPMVAFDARTGRQVVEITAKFGKEKLYRITGHTAHTLFSLFKLQWIRENRPEVFDRAAKLLCFGDLLRYTLTGEAVISDNLAARTMLFDVKQKKWSDEILSFMAFSRDLLPETAPSGHPVGVVGNKVAESLGLEKNVVVATGGHDQSCGSLGAGVTEAGLAAYSLGTVECMTPVFGDCVLTGTMMGANLATYPATLDGLYTTVAFCMTGGSALKWFIDQWCRGEKDHAAESGETFYDRILNTMPKRPTDLLALPHLTATGTPHFDPTAFGVFLGLHLNTTREEILKALLEGIGFEMKLNLTLLEASGVQVKTLRAFGGGVRNKQAMQLKADVLGRAIECLDVREAGCLGAAMLAVQAAGEVRSARDLCAEWVNVSNVYEPDPARQDFYVQRYRVYETIYETVQPIRNKIRK